MKEAIMKIVVIGGSGLIGSKLVPKLREDGHEAIAASPNSGVNTLTGQGLAEALKGASVVVDVSNSPSWEDAAVMKRLLPRKDRTGEADQSLAYSLLDRACDAVLRVPQRPRRHFHRRRQGAFATCAFPADGCRRRRECRRKNCSRPAGKRHRRNWRPGAVSHG